MLSFFSKIVGLLGLSQAFVFPGSGDSTVCSFVSSLDDLSCICKNREDILMSASMNFNIIKIYVSGCGLVNVPFGAVPHLELDKITFSDINELDVKPFAFVGVQTLHTLQIEDIKLLNVWTHGFVGLLNVTNIIIKNVSSMTLQEGAFGGISSIENFLIESCNFGEIKNGAFILTNITMFRVMYSNIDVMDSNSFLIHNAKTVLFQNCSIQEGRNHSFSMAYIDSLTFSKCSFGVLDVNSIHLKYPGSFNFEACTVSELHPSAINVTNVAKNISFTHNIIQFAPDYPLEINRENSSSEKYKNEKLEIFTCCNSFFCDCDIYWMWISEESPYDFKSSFCFETETSLSEMMPVLDSHGNCKTLESKKLKVTTIQGEDKNKEVITKQEGLINLEDSKNLESKKILSDRTSSSRGIIVETILNIPLMFIIVLYELWKFRFMI